jgi:hypothetical protein
MSPIGRDDFTANTKEVLCRRVHATCSNPSCNRATSGPHSNPASSVSIGVASHISAASRGGPRRNESMSSEERSSIENGVWLCQVCAKLIDSDVNRFPDSLLLNWKNQAEENARREISGLINRPSSANHATVPDIYGMTYHDARKLLIASSWQPIIKYPPVVSSLSMFVGNLKEFWGRGITKWLAFRQQVGGFAYSISKIFIGTSSMW